MKMRISVMLAATVLLVAISLISLGQEAPPLTRVLVVDGTKTFGSTMRVAGLVGALRSVGMFEVAVELTDAKSNYDDPLAGRLPNEEEKPYDLVVVLPRGLDDQSIDQIWVISAGLDSLPRSVRDSLAVFSTILDQVLGELAEAIDVSEDLWPGLLWAIYKTKGWIQ